MAIDVLFLVIVYGTSSFSPKVCLVLKSNVLSTYKVNITIIKVTPSIAPVELPLSITDTVLLPAFKYLYRFNVTALCVVEYISEKLYRLPSLSVIVYVAVIVS